MTLEPSKRELLMSAMEIAKILHGYTEDNRRLVLTKAQQILDVEPQLGPETYSPIMPVK